MPQHLLAKEMRSQGWSKLGNWGTVTMGMEGSENASQTPLWAYGEKDLLTHSTNLQYLE